MSVGLQQDETGVQAGAPNLPGQSDSLVPGGASGVPFDPNAVRELLTYRKQREAAKQYEFALSAQRILQQKQAEEKRLIDSADDPTDTPWGGVYMSPTGKLIRKQESPDDRMAKAGLSKEQMGEIKRGEANGKHNPYSWHGGSDDKDLMPNEIEELQRQNPRVNYKQVQEKYVQKRIHDAYNEQVKTGRRWNPTFDDDDQNTLDYWTKKIPVVGRLYSSADELAVKKILEKVRTGTADVEDYKNFGKVLANQEIEHGKEWYQKVGDLVAEAPAFMVEFRAAGGLSKAKSVAGAITKLFTTAAKMPQHVALSAIKQSQAKPQFNEDGSLTFEPGSDDWVKNLVRGYVDTVIEVGSEMSGGAVNKLPGVNEINEFVGRQINSAIGDSALRAKAYEAFKAGGYHGPIAEVFEERLGEGARGLTEYGPEYTQLGEGFGATGDIVGGALEQDAARFGQGLKQVGIEAAAFSAFPAAANAPAIASNALNRVRGKVFPSQPDGSGNVPPPQGTVPQVPPPQGTVPQVPPPQGTVPQVPPPQPAQKGRKPQPEATRPVTDLADGALEQRQSELQSLLSQARSLAGDIASDVGQAAVDVPKWFKDTLVPDLQGLIGKLKGRKPQPEATRPVTDWADGALEQRQSELQSLLSQEFISRTQGVEGNSRDDRATNAKAQLQEVQAELGKRRQNTGGTSPPATGQVPTTDVLGETNEDVQEGNAVSNAAEVQPNGAKTKEQTQEQGLSFNVFGKEHP